MTLRLILCNLIRCNKREWEAVELHHKTLREIEKTTAKLNEMNETLLKATTAWKIYNATGHKKKV